MSHKEDITAFKVQKPQMQKPFVGIFFHQPSWSPFAVFIKMIACGSFSAIVQLLVGTNQHYSRLNVFCVIKPVNNVGSNLANNYHPAIIYQYETTLHPLVYVIFARLRLIVLKWSGVCPNADLLRHEAIESPPQTQVRSLFLQHIKSINTSTCHKDSVGGVICSVC